MIFRNSSKRKIAFVLLLVWCYNLFLPSAAWALTSGPSQPEVQGFQPAGVSDMVDLSTGDFKYNIPLLDVEGYPLNLSYQSGTGMDDEASWVGTGWNMNVGAVNRQLRGNPDDFAGDTVKTEHYTKPKVTVGGKLTAKVELKGKPKVFGSLSFGIFSDNYTGIGAELGVNAGMSFSMANAGFLTADLGIGAGLSSNTSSGVDFSKNISLSIGEKATGDLTTQMGLTAARGYNTRAGMKSLSLSSSFSASSQTFKTWNTGIDGPGSFISYNTEPISPKIQIPYKSSYGSFSFDVGGVAWAVFLAGGGTGYKSVREIASRYLANPAYGFLYADLGKDDPTALMDFTREKDNPIIKDIPNLALPVHTPDVFSYTSQTGSGQFRVYRGGTGIFFDNRAEDKSSMETWSIEVGVGGYAHGGVSHFDQTTKNVTRKWGDAPSNTYLKNGDFQTNTGRPDQEKAYFRQVGEKVAADKDANKLLFNTSPLAVNIGRKTAYSSFSSNIQGDFSVKAPIIRQNRQVKRTLISHLTASDASMAAVDKMIRTYPFNNTDLGAKGDSLTRTGSYRKSHHISEISVTAGDGKRTVYGIPVYNIKQDEYSFAIGRERKGGSGDYSVTAGSNQVSFNSTAGTIDHKKGIDHYFHKESQPAYASSFLLTAILSADYIDKTNNGVTEDDAGTAYKFSYSKLPYSYRWRTPYDKATLNKALLADPDDDKASIIYGEKEVYYASSIESKNMVAYFITEDRKDGLGVKDWRGGKDLTNRLKLLKEIRLYSKSDLTAPIKTVVFNYSYDLCKGVPNSENSETGKLTLKSVHFLYGKSGKGKNHPYKFTYNQGTATDTTTTRYAYMSTDRWGVYKNQSENLSPSLTNEEFPYTSQKNRPQTDRNAAVWHLSKIDLPTGGSINVSYESDDYAFVQNKKAMYMTKFESLAPSAGATTTSLRDAKGINIRVAKNAPQGSQTAWFKRQYLDGSDYLYTKLFVKVSAGEVKSYGNDYDFVSCYAKIKSVSVKDSTASVIFEDITEKGKNYNPVIIAAWQHMKNNYPRYAYPGFENRVKDSDAGKALAAAVKAVVHAAENLDELKLNFYEKAFKKKYADVIDMSKSFVRIVKPDGIKLGGGVRVKKIYMTDEWSSMSGDEDAQQPFYGQTYEYTTVYDGKTISSGVASYEPGIGNDENALKQPVPYIQNIKGAVNNYFALETPFGESFYPAPQICYSKVRVRDLDENGNADPAQRTGYIQNEFYTARDFPVKVSILPIKQNVYNPPGKYSMFQASSIDERTYSQGYNIELNDMHGQAKAVRVYNSSGAEISSTEYLYNVDNQNADEKHLNNTVTVVNQNAIVDEQDLGLDIEMFTDMREQESSNNGKSIHLGVDVIPAFWVPIPIPHKPKYDNNDYKLFRSACVVKVIQRFGLVKTVVKRENGSSIETENLAYDGLTGDVLVTRTQNEFEDNIYSVNLPAYWAYPGMSHAYKNHGILIMQTPATKVLVAHPKYFNKGDQVLNSLTGKMYWVGENGGSKVFLDESGAISNPLIGLFRIVRSGNRNMLESKVASIVSLENPISGSIFKLAAATNLDNQKVINATAAVYDDNWATEAEQGGSTTANKRYLVENAGSFKFITGNPTSTRGAYLDFENANRPGQLYTSGYWSGPQGPIERSHIKAELPNALNNPEFESLSFDTCITVPQSKDYYIGAAAASQIAFNFDNKPSAGNSFASYENRWIVTKQYLTAGSHKLTVSVFRTSVAGSGDYSGLEIYNNTLQELKNAPSTGSGIDILFSTAGLRDKTNLKSYWKKYSGSITYPAVYHYTEPNGAAPDPCYAYAPAPGSKVVNPFLHGYAGNWRLYETKVFQGMRRENALFTLNKGAGIRTGGYFTNFFAFWTNPGNSATPWTKSASTQWVTANTVTLYDDYGQELENRDALGRYSAALFEFRGQLPAAVASNAMNREIYANSFEDNISAISSRKEFVVTSGNQQPGLMIDTRESHSGNRSVKLQATGIQLFSATHNIGHKKNNYLVFNSTKGFMTRSITGLYPAGFEPLPGKKYVFNAWVKDGTVSKNSSGISLMINNTEIPVTCKSIVEGWKLVEGVINTGILPGKEFSLSIKPGSSSATYIDDLRIFPFDAHIKTYAYNNKNLRLMAELDENGFATFYEYDEEGSLVRVKKETERGIVTLKETRSSYKRGSI